MIQNSVSLENRSVPLDATVIKESAEISGISAVSTDSQSGKMPTYSKFGPFIYTGWEPDHILQLGFRKDIIDEQGVIIRDDYPIEEELSKELVKSASNINSFQGVNGNGCQINPQERAKRGKPYLPSIQIRFKEVLEYLYNLNGLVEGPEIIGGAVHYFLGPSFYKKYLATRLRLGGEQFYENMHQFYEGISRVPNDFDVRVWMDENSEIGMNTPTFKSYASQVVHAMMTPRLRGYMITPEIVENCYFEKLFLFPRENDEMNPPVKFGMGRFGQFCHSPIEVIWMMKTNRPSLFTRDGMGLAIKVHKQYRGQLKVEVSLKYIYPKESETAPEGGDKFSMETAIFHQPAMVLDVRHYEGINWRGWIIAMALSTKGWRSLKRDFFSNLWNIFEHNGSLISAEITWAVENHISVNPVIQACQKGALRWNILISLIDQNRVDDELIRQLEERDFCLEVVDAKEPLFNREILRFLGRIWDIKQLSPQLRLALFRFGLGIIGKNRGLPIGMLSVNYGGPAYRISNSERENSVVWIPVKFSESANKIDRSLNGVPEAIQVLEEMIDFSAQSSNGLIDLQKFYLDEHYQEGIEEVIRICLQSRSPDLLRLGLRLELLSNESVNLDAEWWSLLPILLRKYPEDLGRFDGFFSRRSDAELAKVGVMEVPSLETILDKIKWPFYLVTRDGQGKKTGIDQLRGVPFDEWSEEFSQLRSNPDLYFYIYRNVCGLQKLLRDYPLLHQADKRFSSLMTQMLHSYQGKGKGKRDQKTYQVLHSKENISLSDWIGILLLHPNRMISDVGLVLINELPAEDQIKIWMSCYESLVGIRVELIGERLHKIQAIDLSLEELKPFVIRWIGKLLTLNDSKFEQVLIKAQYILSNSCNAYKELPNEKPDKYLRRINSILRPGKKFYTAVQKEEVTPESLSAPISEPKPAVASAPMLEPVPASTPSVMQPVGKDVEIRQAITYLLSSETDGLDIEEIERNIQIVATWFMKNKKGCSNNLSWNELSGLAAQAYFKHGIIEMPMWNALFSVPLAKNRDLQKVLESIFHEDPTCGIDRFGRQAAELLRWMWKDYFPLIKDEWPVADILFVIDQIYPETGDERIFDRRCWYRFTLLRVQETCTAGILHDKLEVIVKTGASPIKRDELVLDLFESMLHASEVDILEMNIKPMKIITRRIARFIFNLYGPDDSRFMYGALLFYLVKQGNYGVPFLLFLGVIREFIHEEVVIQSLFHGLHTLFKGVFNDYAVNSKSLLSPGMPSEKHYTDEFHDFFISLSLNINSSSDDTKSVIFDLYKELTPHLMLGSQILVNSGLRELLRGTSVQMWFLYVLIDLKSILGRNVIGKGQENALDRNFQLFEAVCSIFYGMISEDILVDFIKEYFSHGDPVLKVLYRNVEMAQESTNKQFPRVTLIPSIGRDSQLFGLEQSLLDNIDVLSSYVFLVICKFSHFFSRKASEYDQMGVVDIVKKFQVFVRVTSDYIKNNQKAPSILLKVTNLMEKNGWKGVYNRNRKKPPSVIVKLISELSELLEMEVPGTLNEKEKLLKKFELKLSSFLASVDSDSESESDVDVLCDQLNQDTYVALMIKLYLKWGITEEAKWHMVGLNLMPEGKAIRELLGLMVPENRFGLNVLGEDCRRFLASIFLGIVIHPGVDRELFKAGLDVLMPLDSLDWRILPRRVLCLFKMNLQQFREEGKRKAFTLRLMEANAAKVNLDLIELGCRFLASIDQFVIAEASEADRISYFEVIAVNLEYVRLHYGDFAANFLGIVLCFYSEGIDKEEKVKYFPYTVFVCKQLIGPSTDLQNLIYQFVSYLDGMICTYGKADKAMNDLMINFFKNSSDLLVLFARLTGMINRGMVPLQGILKDFFVKNRDLILDFEGLQDTYPGGTYIVRATSPIGWIATTFVEFKRWVNNAADMIRLHGFPEYSKQLCKMISFEFCIRDVFYDRIQQDDLLLFYEELLSYKNLRNPQMLQDYTRRVNEGVLFDRDRFLFDLHKIETFKFDEVRFVNYVTLVLIYFRALFKEPSHLFSDQAKLERCYLEFRDFAIKGFGDRTKPEKKELFTALLMVDCVARELRWNIPICLV